MAFPIIGYLSMAELAAATITDPGTATGYDIDNIADHRAFTLWVSDTTVTPINIDIDAGSAVQADYLALIHHNLNANAATVAVYADDNAPFATPENPLTAVAPAEDTVTFKGFTSPGAYRYWRIQIAHAAAFPTAPYIGVVKLGLRTTLTEMLNPEVDPFMKQVEVRGERSEGGNYLGSILGGQRHRAELAFGGPAGMARSFLTSDLNAFIDNHAIKRRPFVFVLDTADADFDVARWVKVTDGGEISRTPVGGMWSRMVVRLPVEEALSETA
jgi:hypothetical protein